LVTNQAGVDAHGVSSVERLRAAGASVVALFSPEHGYRGAADPGAAVATSIDSATGLPIYSLYGQTSAPTEQMLSGIDLILVDLQDAGARYFTYLYTTVEVMRAAAKAGIPVVVLDRPNPLGDAIEGNVLDPAFSSPVGLLAIPMRHGMTLGELSRLAVADLGLSTRLTVVPVSGWRRSQRWPETGLPFVPPSPNLRSVTALLHYPGLCLFEGTALSVGRGSDAPFEQIGAPWLDTAGVLRAVRGFELPGAKIRATTFTPHAPGDGKYADVPVAGLRLSITDPGRYDPIYTALLLLSVIQRLQPERLGWRPAAFDRLAGGPALREAIEAGQPAAAIVLGWQADLARFKVRRVPYLLY
jgi:uncharacterized protein YbbC (DUF1343 family)